MPRGFQVTPVFTEEAVRQTFHVRSDDPHITAGGKNPIALPEECQRVGHVFDHVIHGDHVKGPVWEAGFFQGAQEDGQAPGAAHGDRLWVYVHTGHVPAQRPHQTQIGTVAAPHVQKAPPAAPCGKQHFQPIGRPRPKGRDDSKGPAGDKTQEAASVFGRISVAGFQDQPPQGIPELSERSRPIRLARLGGLVCVVVFVDFWNILSDGTGVQPDESTVGTMPESERPGDAVQAIT
jgi:hypothetical protein